MLVFQWFRGTLQGVPTVLKGDSTQWKLHKDKTAAVPSRRRNYVQPDAAPWLLEDRHGSVTQKGQLEGGIATSNYFVLVKNGGSFTVLPVTGWYTFKPPPRFASFNLAPVQNTSVEQEMPSLHPITLYQVTGML